MSEQQENKNIFVREMIKNKPKNKRKLLNQVGLAMIFGIVFALVACIVFLIMLPSIMENAWKNYTTDPSKTGGLTLQTPQQSTPSYLIDMKDYVISVEDYQNINNQMYAVGKSADAFIVEITSVVQDTDVFHNNYEMQGQGTGIIVLDTGQQIQILTEQTVISDASEINVTFYDGSKASAKLLGIDKGTGLALIAIDRNALSSDTIVNLRVAPLLDSAWVKNGAVVVAVGSPLGTNRSVLTGTVTSRESNVSVEDFNYTLLTTNIIAEKNASGALLNTQGQVVGFILQKFYSEGTAHTLSAIPASDLINVIEKLGTREKIPNAGLYLSTVTDEMVNDYGMPKGIYIRSVAMDSPAMAAGLQSGDIIVKFNDEFVTTSAGYSNKLLELKPGDTVKVTIKRQGASGYTEITCKLTLEEQ